MHENDRNNDIYFVNSTIYINANWSIIIDPADDLDIKIILSDNNPK